MAVIEEAPERAPTPKAKLVAATFKAIELGSAYANRAFTLPDALKLEPRTRTAGPVMWLATPWRAWAEVYAGATVGAWYTITLTSATGRFKQITAQSCGG